MKNWKIILTFTYPHEAHLAKNKLEAEGIQVWIKDELTAQVNNFYSNAIGGVKLFVQETDYDAAIKILINSGYISEPKQETNKFLDLLESSTSKVSFLKKMRLELRLIIIAIILTLIIAIPITIASLPSKTELLTKTSWCADKIDYKGSELIPNTLGLQVVSEFDNCDQTIDFRENGIVYFPGSNSYKARYDWKLKGRKLIITQSTDQYKNKTYLDSIFIGTYNLKITFDYIELQSENTIIYGKQYRFDYNF